MPDHPEALSNRLKKLALVNQKNSSLNHKNLASEVVRTITLTRLSTRCSLEGPIGVDGSQLFRCRRLSYPALEVRSELLVFWKGLHRIINPVICHTDRDKALSVGKGTDGIQNALWPFSFKRFYYALARRINFGALVRLHFSARNRYFHQNMSFHSSIWFVVLFRWRCTAYQRHCLIVMRLSRRRGREEWILFSSRPGFPRHPPDALP